MSISTSIEVYEIDTIEVLERVDGTFDYAIVLVGQKLSFKE
jgi:hypothetical protein